jgi:hypothetical protein
MPGNSCGPGRVRGRSGTTAGTAARPEGCSRAGRRRTGAGKTGSGGRGTCASQRHAASRRATLLPPLGMSPSVMSGASDRISGCGRFWVPVGAADGHCGRFGRGFLRKRNQASRARRRLAWLRRASARHAVSRGLRAAGQVRAFGEPALRRLLPSGGCLANPRSAPGRAWRAVFDAAAPAQGIECFADREQLGRRNIHERPCGGHLDKQAAVTTSSGAQRARIRRRPAPGQARHNVERPRLMVISFMLGLPGGPSTRGVSRAVRAAGRLRAPALPSRRPGPLYEPQCEARLRRWDGSR